MQTKLIGNSFHKGSAFVLNESLFVLYNSGLQDSSTLIGRTVKIVYNKDAHRELLVLQYAKGNCPANATSPGSFGSKSKDLLNMDQRLNTAQWRCAQLLANEMYMDTPAAFFYLEQAGWNAELAKSQFCKFFYRTFVQTNPANTLAFSVKPKLTNCL